MSNMEININPPFPCSQCSDTGILINHSLYTKTLILIIFLGSISCGIGTYFELYNTFSYRPHASFQLFYLMGVIIGSCCSALLMPYIGRRMPLVYTVLPTYVVILVNAFVQGIHVADLITRLLSGFSTGAYFTTVVVFLGELSYKSFRAKNYAVMTFGLWIGLVLYVFFYKLHPLLSLFMLIFPTGFIILGLVYLPESPYYVMQINQPEFAAEVLYFLRCGSLSRQEAEFMSAARYVYRNCGTYWGFVRRWSVLDRFVTVLLLCTFCNFSGFYLFIICVRVIGANNSNSGENIVGGGFTISKFDIIGYLLVAVASITGFLVYIFLVDRCARYLLLRVSFLGTSCCVLVLNFYFGILESIEMLYLLIPVFFLFFFMGQGSMPFLMIGEIFSYNTKPAFCGVAISSYFILMALGNFLTREIWLGGGPLLCCIFFTLQSVFALVFAVLLIPGYRNYSLEDVQGYFDGMQRSSTNMKEVRVCAMPKIKKSDKNV